MQRVWKAGLIALFFSSTHFAHAGVWQPSEPPFSTKELNIVQSYVYANIASEQHALMKETDGRIMHALNGAVIASPSHQSNTFTQDYEFHWVRDAALTMNEVVQVYAAATATQRKQLRPYLSNYIQFEKVLQAQTSPHAYINGEPKFNIDGTLWLGPWGRPQHDGPALRAMTLIQIAQLFLEEGQEQDVRQRLLPLIINDLDFVRIHWREPNYDLWEEVYDEDHFFNKMVQRKALLQGAALCKQLNEQWRPDWYTRGAIEIANSLEGHWNASRGYFSETINQQAYKGGGLNSAIILGVLYGDLGNPNDPFAINSDRVMNTVYFIRNSFAGLYKINLDHPNRPPFIGRYPSDVYDGDQSLYGNPWFLTTHALAEYYFKLASISLQQGQLSITPNNLRFFKQINKKLFNQIEEVSVSINPGRFYTMVTAIMNVGDQLLQASKAHAVCYNPNSCLHFSEQLDRSSGEQVSAADLTWSYATLLTAMQAREAIGA